MQPKLIVEQKITALVNKYAVYGANADGSKGQLLAFAQQKRFAFREKVIFYSDEQKITPVFSFRAEKVIDVHGRYIVEDPEGQAVGIFRKEFARSLVNSTWHILGADGQPKVTVGESSMALAVFRRFGGQIPLVGGLIEIITLFLKYHFSLKDAASGQEIGRYQKTRLFRDHYLLTINQEAFDQLDWRVIASVAVALDALQSR